MLVWPFTFSRGAAAVMASDLAGQARTGPRVQLCGGEVFDVAMTSFAERYADQNERDYEALRDAARRGRIVVREGL
jgi:hypothetical protein